MIESVINEATMIANQLEQIRVLICAADTVVVRGDFHPGLVEHANVPSPQRPKEVTQFEGQHSDASAVVGGRVAYREAAAVVAAAFADRSRADDRPLPGPRHEARHRLRRAVCAAVDDEHLIGQGPLIG
jgi:hypothetical protein